MFRRKNKKVKYSAAYEYYIALLNTKEIIIDRLKSNVKKYVALYKTHRILDGIIFAKDFLIMTADLASLEKKKLENCIRLIQHDLVDLSDVLEKICVAYHRLDTYFPEKYMFTEPSFGNKAVLSILEDIIGKL